MRENVDYFVRYICLPIHIGGCTVINNDNTFDIYLNARLSDEKKRKALDHELRHIEKNHFHREDLSKEEMEKQAEEGANVSAKKRWFMVREFSTGWQEENDNSEDTKAAEEEIARFWESEGIGEVFLDGC